MDEKLEALTSSEKQAVEAGVSPANSQIAADTAATTARPLDLNEVQELSGEELESLARDLHLHLHPGRSRHQHVLDVIRAALATGAIVTAEGFLDQVSDAFAMLRGLDQECVDDASAQDANADANRALRIRALHPKVLAPRSDQVGVL